MFLGLTEQCGIAATTCQPCGDHQTQSLFLIQLFQQRPLDVDAAAWRPPQGSAVEANAAHGEVSREGSADRHDAQPAQPRQVERCHGAIGREIRERQPQAAPFRLRREALRGDNQGERSASIRMRMRRGWADGGRA